MAIPSCVVFLLWFMISGSSADVEQCHEGWYLDNGSCYTYGESRVSWADAQEFCASYGGKLAEIETEEENNFVKNMVKNKKAYQAWIGGTDILSEGKWEWISTGDSLGFTDWATGQPDEYGSGEDCLQYFNPSGYTWNDFSCDVSANFVCEAKSVSNID